MIDDLLRVVAPPQTPRGGVYDWADLANRIGTDVPEDYKALVNAYGPGSYGNFVHIYQPNAPLASFDLGERVSVDLGALEILREGGEYIPYETSGPHGLLPVGRTDNGDVVYWLRRPDAPPESWNVVVNEARGEMWDEFPGDITGFLAAVLSGDYRPTVFPDDFPPPAPTFEPYA